MWDSLHPHTHHTINQIGVSQLTSQKKKKTKQKNQINEFFFITFYDILYFEIVA